MKSVVRAIAKSKLARTLGFLVVLAVVSVVVIGANTRESARVNRAKDYARLLDGQVLVLDLNDPESVRVIANRERPSVIATFEGGHEWKPGAGRYRPGPWSESLSVMATHDGATPTGDDFTPRQEMTGGCASTSAHGQARPSRACRDERERALDGEGGFDSRSFTEGWCEGSRVQVPVILSIGQ